ncbi:MAG: peptidoglycan DD-metalloendopeptidase family protein [Candidatus Peregrinibacteria bacterium]
MNTAMIGPARGIEYTEDLLEVTDEGVFDPFGNFIDLSPQEAIVEPPAKAPEELDVRADSFEEYRQTIINNWGGKKEFSEKRLEDIKKNLETELRSFEELGQEINRAETELEPIKKEIETLTDQIELFNEQLRFTRQKINDVEVQIAERQLDMRNIMEDVKKNEVALNVQKQAVLDYIALLYNEEAQFMDLYSDGSSTLKLLLADNSVSENLLGREYVAVMEQTGRKVFHDLEESYFALRERQAALLLSQTKLNRLYTSLEQEKQILEETRQSKTELLEQTQGEKERYEALLEESIRQQLESALAIQNMKDNIELIESKLELLDEKLEAEQAQLKSSESESAPDIPFPENESTPGDTFFDWPVEPNAITAYFHDPTYPKQWGIHNAIDIRARQFTEIHAPANGYVVEAKDNGFGYSYIILAHKKNLVTVYGHVTEIQVKPGTLVEKGEVIGLTGGTPGTKGAGLQTTGPHLHFEVHFKGEVQNPLDYLSVLELPIEYIPEEYLN